MGSPYRPRGVFGTGRKRTPRVVARARLMLKSVSDAPSLFPNPPMNLADFEALIDATVDAQVAAEQGGKSLFSLRDVARNSLWAAMETMRVFIQNLADNAQPADARALIEASGLVLAKSSAHGKPLLQAVLGDVEGMVHVIANASVLTGRSKKKATFNWQWRANDSAIWQSVASTPYADTEIGPLGAGTYQFRASVTLGRTTGTWTDPVNLSIY
jgi:hypothetical protein